MGGDQGRHVVADLAVGGASAGARTDVPFSNIRHLIFQPCKTKEVITILHLHLKNPIMVGNKKTKVCRDGPGRDPPHARC